MIGFEQQVLAITGGGLFCQSIDTLQINVGLRCNQSCEHCHLGCSPSRSETMEWHVMESILDAIRNMDNLFIDITGGAPELNPYLGRFIRELCSDGRDIGVRTNLTALLEPGMDALMDLFKRESIQLTASMPCYLEKNVDAQRGTGIHSKCIEVLRKLNRLGFGIDPSLILNLVYNPGGPFLPPDQSALEMDYRSHLEEDHEVFFSNLRTITNMPLGRFRDELIRQNMEQGYWDLLRNSFNSQTIDGLMCRYQVSVRWDGTLFDCDFNLALDLPVGHGVPHHIREFEPGVMAGRRVVTGEHCYGCTAGCGSSCNGALV